MHRGLHGPVWAAVIAVVLFATGLALPTYVARPTAAADAVQVPAPGQSAIVDSAKKAGALRGGVIPILPWVGQDPKTQQYFGPAIDVGKRVAELLGVKLDLVPTGFDTVIAGLQAKQFDMTLAGLFVTEKRKEVVDFVVYDHAGTCYAALKSNTKVTDLASLNDPKVVIGDFSGQATDQEIRKKYPKATVDSVAAAPGQLSRILDVLSKRIDVTFFDSPLAVVMQARYPTVKIIPGGAQYCLAHPDIPVPIGFAFAKGDPAFAKFLDAVVQSMRQQIDAGLLKYSSPEFVKEKI